ncbi:Thermostable 8-oxoguanine DNA glycosylase [Archaeoglobus sulfaticallidus PM70-1]|uniref:8-oxoguanine DNA glycosylase/AP lyase n=1 Tax=Archaeoglobus sulfaticallidus PM70-1 TaxID=387631 RepID=N0BJJ7_9EURY|nr:Thermostable 8-oxoguanine DNA glycosylase [Archaeoglobus sulfaticallidus PM70-1]
MRSLIEKVRAVKPIIHREVNRRINEFLSFRHKGNEFWFSELCFCILTANSSAELGIRIQKELGFDGFYYMDKEKLSERLKDLGHRFYNKRAEYIVLARRFRNIKDIIQDIVHSSGEFEAREWLVRNVKGLGYKEASHFMRNVGYLNFAILDRHILKLLSSEGIIEKPKTLSRRKYLEIEKVFVEIAEKLSMSPGELDLNLWYLSTGKVLK